MSGAFQTLLVTNATSEMGQQQANGTLQENEFTTSSEVDQKAEFEIPPLISQPKLFA